MSRAKTFVPRWVQQHLDLLRLSYQRQIADLKGSVLTWIMIGISLSIPLVMSLFLSNLRTIDFGWQGSSQITAYTRSDLSSLEAGLLADRLRKRNTISEVQLITKEDALAEFQSATDLDEVLGFIESNPLPNVILVKPIESKSSIEAMREMGDSLSALPEIESVQIDAIWLKRLFSLMELVNITIYVLGVLLVTLAILVVANTIRILIDARKREIIVVKLVGGTESFIRRPFLYSGFVYGLMGGVIGLVLSIIATYLISLPLSEFASSYALEFRFDGLSFWLSLGLLASGGALGLLSAWFSVQRQLGLIEPQ